MECSQADEKGSVRAFRIPGSFNSRGERKAAHVKIYFLDSGAFPENTDTSGVF